MNLSKIILGVVIVHDTFLLAKISQSINKLCEDNQIKKIDELTVIVNHGSHINEKNLYEHLTLHNKEIVTNDLKIEIQRQSIEEQTAIIKSIKGETFKKSN